MTLAACSPTIARWLNPAGSTPANTSDGLASSLPRAHLMLISQIEAALAKHLARVDTFAALSSRA